VTAAARDPGGGGALERGFRGLGRARPGPTRRPIARVPSPAKPSSIIALVEGSGTASPMMTVREPSSLARSMRSSKCVKTLSVFFCPFLRRPAVALSTFASAYPSFHRALESPPAPFRFGQALGASGSVMITG